VIAWPLVIILLKYLPFPEGRACHHLISVLSPSVTMAYIEIHLNEYVMVERKGGRAEERSLGGRCCHVSHHGNCQQHEGVNGMAG
jgi:hypothetical protein